MYVPLSIDLNAGGVWPSPFMTDLYLCCCGKRRLLQTKRWDLQKASTFSNNFKLIDNLCTINNDDFEGNYNDISPDVLRLKKGNSDSCKISFLDLLKEVHDSKCSNELFDERDALLDSNIPSKIFHDSTGSETLRIARITTRANLLLIPPMIGGRTEKPLEFRVCRLP